MSNRAGVSGSAGADSPSSGISTWPGSPTATSTVAGRPTSSRRVWSRSASKRRVTGGSPDVPGDTVARGGTVAGGGASRSLPPGRDSDAATAARPRTIAKRRSARRKCTDLMLGGGGETRPRDFPTHGADRARGDVRGGAPVPRGDRPRAQAPAQQDRLPARDVGDRCRAPASGPCARRAPPRRGRRVCLPAAARGRLPGGHGDGGRQAGRGHGALPGRGRDPRAARGFVSGALAGVAILLREGLGARKK